VSYFGGHFPEGDGLSFWGGHFPEGDEDIGLSPSGAATFALVLESGVKVTYAWQTGLFKSYSGLERRSNLVDDPAQRFEGEAVLVGDQARAARTRLAKFAALGQPFLLGLSYEALVIDQPSTGTTVHVPTTALSDWAVYGARVVVRHGIGNGHYEFAEAVITAVGANTIEVDVALGSVGAEGAELMPAFAVFLDAQQGFARYRPAEPIERWGIRARNAIAGFSSASIAARLPLEAPQTNSGMLDGLTLVANEAGADGNAIVITQSDDALTSGGELVEDVAAKTLHIKYSGNSTTALEYVTLLAGSSLVRVIGTYVDTDILPAADDEFAPTAMSGGANATPVEVGRGAVVTEFDGRPVWDRDLNVNGTALDSLQSLATVQDLGGLPFVAGATAIPDWGRAIGVRGELGMDWQWVKRFLDAVRASWRSFWLPTWRRDLVAVSSGVGTLTIASGEDAGDLLSWWPTQRAHLQIWQADNTKTYVRVASATDNHDGTITLSIVDDVSAPVTLSGSAIDVVSWLERVRLEGDTVDVTFSDAEFEADLTARVIQQRTDASGANFLRDESGSETSQPREGIEVRYGLVLDRIATGTRDVVINGATYRASAAARAEVKIPTAGTTDEIEVTLPLAHALAQRWNAQGVPPNGVRITVYRQQSASGFVEQFWQGEVTSMQIDAKNHLAMFRVPSGITTALARPVPTLTAGSACPHFLYDPNTCRVDRAAAEITRTVLTFSGRTVTMSAALPATGWADGGELVHVSTGEPMTIIEHVGNTVTIQMPIVGMAVGDAVTIAPGCAKDIITCRDKYANVANFGGFPQLPAASSNPFKPDGWGIYSSS
jgi:uncharacterized phage protein (TIGR02218 family)